MRVVLDTNVWISALLFPGGVCDQLIERFRLHSSVQIFTSPFILEEFELIAKVKLEFSSQEVDIGLRALKALSLVVNPRERVRVVKEKDSDNRILECALEAQADLLITGDTKHLLPLRIFHGILIRSPREVLELW